MAWEMQFEEGQHWAENTVQNMKKGLQVFGDKWAHSGDNMKDGVNVMT